MNTFFIFLAILLIACTSIVVGHFVTASWKRRQDSKAMMARDIKVKNQLIAELTLQNRMLQVELNMTRLVLERKTKRGLYAVENRPALLQPQV